MKNIKNLLYAMMCLVALCLQTNISAKRLGGAEPVQPVVEVVEKNATKNVSEATLAVQAIKIEAQNAIDMAKKQLEMGEITPAQAAKIIGENKFKISQVEKQLAEVVEDEVANVAAAEAEQGRLDWFVSGVRDLGQGAMGLARAGQIYSEEEKAVADAIIKELDVQIKDLKDNYIQEVKTASASEKAMLTAQYEQEKQELENALSEQRIIAGKEMSSGMQKFWGAVGLAGAVTGGLLLRNYYGGPQPAIQMPAEPEADISTMPMIERLKQTVKNSLRNPSIATEELPLEFGQGAKLSNAEEQAGASLRGLGSEIGAKIMDSGIGQYYTDRQLNKQLEQQEELQLLERQMEQQRELEPEADKETRLNQLLEQQEQMQPAEDLLTGQMEQQRKLEDKAVTRAANKVRAEDRLKASQDSAKARREREASQNITQQ